MSKKAIEAFVRAKPAEISVTETYRYKAEIANNNHLSFKEANGEIKVKFFYDGQGFHWKIPELLKQWFPLRKVTKGLVQYTGQYSLAKVGHLVLQGFQKPNFRERWPESKALPLTIPIDNLEEKFTQSQKYELCYTYHLEKPENPLISLDEIRLTDESKGNSRSSWTQTD